MPRARRVAAFESLGAGRHYSLFPAGASISKWGVKRYKRLEIVLEKRMGRHECNWYSKPVGLGASARRVAGEYGTRRREG